MDRRSFGQRIGICCLRLLSAWLLFEAVFMLLPVLRSAIALSPSTVFPDMIERGEPGLVDGIHARWLRRNGTAVPKSATWTVSIAPKPLRPVSHPADLTPNRPMQAATCRVSNAADSGPGTLRSCLSEASPSMFIDFDAEVFPPTQPTTIALTSALPAITAERLTIDASHSGVVLDGRYLTSNENGLHIDGVDHVTIRGLQVVNFPANGIELGRGASNATIGGKRTMGSGPLGQGNLLSGNGGAGILIGGVTTISNTVIGNWVGTDLLGTSAMSNRYGIVIAEGASQNSIGSSFPSERNLLSGNRFHGILLNSRAAYNRIIGNLIGPDLDGTGAMANGEDGIAVWNGASHNQIGGDQPGEHNVISGNGGNGVAISGTSVTGNLVIGNHIGTDIGGTKPLPNGENGVAIYDGASDNAVGGDTPGQGNLISGNQLSGISIYGSGTSENRVTGNLIGTDALGQTRLPNADKGVALWDGAHDNVIGGQDAGQRNLISGNTGDGVIVFGGDTTENFILGNFIGTNLSGTSAISNTWNGISLSLSAYGNSVTNNVVSGNGWYGIRLCGVMSNTLVGNLIGTDVAGTGAIANQYSGIGLAEGAFGNTIGGLTAGERNVISGNKWHGISMMDDGTTDNVVIGNYVGTNISGTAALPNEDAGISISGGATQNRVGGDAIGAGNLISGNGKNGVQLGGEGTTQNVISNNRIGTNAQGLAAIPNGYDGASIMGRAASNVITGNVISGNGDDGVAIGDLGTDGNQLTSNIIGADASGAGPLPNFAGGVNIWGGAQSNMVGPGNCVAYNYYGVSVAGSSSRGNKITQNCICKNTLGIGIYLVDGANGGIASPAIITATRTVVVGTGPADAVIEVFSDEDGQGCVYEGSTEANGLGQWSLSKPEGLGGPCMTATATDAGGNTSAFSVAFCVSRIYLPVIMKRPYFCREPANNTRDGACGPMMSNVEYREYISSQSDEFDWFYFDMASTHTIEAWLTMIPEECDYDLYLTDADGNLIRDSANHGNQDEYIVTGSLPGGRYHLGVTRIEGWNTTQPYVLRVER